MGLSDTASINTALSVTILGCSGTYAGPGGACSGYLVRGGGTTVWVDTGPGTLGNLQQHVDITALDAVVVSHSHPDHWGELGVLRNALKYGFQVEGMPVYSTSAVRALVDIVCGDSSEPTFRWGIVADGDRDAHQLGRQVDALLRRHRARVVARSARPRRRPRSVRSDVARRDRGHRTAPLRTASRHLGEGRARAAAGGHPLLAHL